MGLDENCVSVDDARLLIDDPRYVIDEFIGSGAMACVYKVHERGTPNVYALKLLREQFWKRERFKEIFEREARHMRDLQYPNIVRFYKFAADERSAYILMDYVEGKPLTTVIRESRRFETPVPLDKIVRIMAQIARAISYLHAEGFIHRDIKPGNVLLAGQNESAFLTDLGIAGAIDEPSMSGAGTPSYMPYEQQVRGKIDHTVDVYAFGIMMYELLTGQKPFQPPPGLSFNDARKAMVELHRKADIPDITKNRDDLPNVVNQYFQQALAKNPADRYGDILDFAKDIHEAVLNRLPDDLRNFDTIQAQEMTRSVTDGKAARPVVIVNDDNGIDYRVIAGGVIAIVAIIGLMVVLLQTNSTVTVTDTPVVAGATTAGETVTIDETPTTTLTAEIDPFVLVEGVDAVGYLDALNPAIAYAASVREGVVPLTVPDDTPQFQVDVALEQSASLDEARYGLIFNRTDAQNFVRFEINAVAEDWRLTEFTDGEAVILQSDSLDTIPDEWRVTVAGGTITIAFDEVVATRPYTPDLTGQIALWMPLNDDGVLPVETLTISLPGLAATLARETESGVVIQPDALDLLAEDVAALLATGNETAVVDCVTFDDVYDRLDAHRVIDGADASIDDIQAISPVIATRCNVESENDAVNFNISDYFPWADAMTAILQSLNNG